MIYVTRRETFAASHRLHNPNLGEEENQQIFGKCCGIYGHGHNYVLEVTVSGQIDPKTGYVIDAKILKKIIKEQIISKIDHKHMNFEVDFLKDTIPTAENICLKIWDQIKDKIPSGKLYSVKLYETENNYFEYKGE